MILSVGYRVNSVNATRFRQRANTVLKQYLLQGYSINRQMVALQQHMDDRLLKIENRLDRQQEDIDFYIKSNQQPSELVIPTGCVWDAYSYLSDLVRGLTTIIRTEIDPEYILRCVKWLIVSKNLAVRARIICTSANFASDKRKE